MIWSTLLLLAVAAADPVVDRTATLRCGDIDLRLTSRSLAGRAAPLAPIVQTLTRRVGARRVPVALEASRPVMVEGGRVRDRYVSSWACLTGRRGAQYVLLGYACAVDPGDRRDCGGEKAWFRLLDERGRPADAGVPHDGAARDRLQARLGIAGAMAAGVTMTPVID